MSSKTFHFELNKTKLYGQIWEPTKPKAVVVLVHGMGEHIFRYTDFVIPKLVENNYVVIGFDQFGHGKSEGKRGHCPNYEALLNMIEAVIKKGEEQFSDLPMYLYGHSMGGNLVINYILKKTNKIKGVIATSPFLRLAFQPPKWKMVIGKLLLKIAPSIALSSELEVEAISRDKKEVKIYEDDKMVHDKISPMYTFPIIENGAWAIKNANKLKTPMLVLHGTGDRIIDYKASEEFCKKTEKATIKLFEDGYHELHHDLCKEEFMETILTWINRK